MNTVKTKKKPDELDYLVNDAIIEKSLLTHGDRIRYMRIKKGLSQEHVVSKVRTLTQSMLSAYESNTRGTKLMTIPTMIKLAEVLEVSLDWLLAGKNKAISHGRFIPLPDKYAPVISWDQIHSWKYKGKENMTLSKVEYIPIFGTQSDNCFGLKIEDEIIAPCHPFALNDIILVDADKKPEPNSYVIISHDDGINVHLRQYVQKDDGNYALRLLEEASHEEVTASIIIYGVVIGKFMGL